MSQQYPGPGQNPHQPQQPYGQNPTGGPYPHGAFPPPQPPKKRMSGWAITGIVVGGLFAFLLVLGAIVGPQDTGSTDSKPDTAAAALPSETAAPAEPATKAPAAKPAAKPKPAPEAPVQVTAKKTAFKASILAQGSDYTSVKVTVTNNSDDTISINPLYFAITDTDGSKHTAELGVDEQQMDTVDLAPGENITGTITAKGGFTPKYVTYTDGLFGDGIRGNVS